MLTSVQCTVCLKVSLSCFSVTSFCSNAQIFVSVVASLVCFVTEFVSSLIVYMYTVC